MRCYERCDNDGDVLGRRYLHTDIYTIKNKIYIYYIHRGYLHIYTPTCTSSGTKSFGVAPSAPSRISENGSCTARKNRQIKEVKREKT